jgi:hypothetical protein
VTSVPGKGTHNTETSEPARSTPVNAPSRTAAARETGISPRTLGLIDIPSRVFPPGTRRKKRDPWDCIWATPPPTSPQ